MVKKEKKKNCKINDKNSNKEIPKRVKKMISHKKSTKIVKVSKSKSNAIKVKKDVKKSNQINFINENSKNYINLTAFTSGHNGIYFFNSVTGELYFKVENKDMEYIDRFIFHSGKVYIAGGRYDDNMAIGITIYEYNPLNNSYNKLFFDNEEYVESINLDTNKNIIKFIGEKTIYIDLSTSKLVKKPSDGKYDKQFIQGEDTENRNQRTSFNGIDLIVNKGTLVSTEKNKKVSFDLSKIEGLMLDLKKDEYFLQIQDNLLMISDTNNGISLFLIKDRPNLEIQLLLSTNVKVDQTYYYHLEKL